MRRSILVALATIPVVGLLSACGPKVPANYTSTQVPTVHWHYYNPLGQLQDGWETDFKTSPQKLDTSKGVTVAGTGLASGGMKSSRVTARVLWGDCVAVVNGWIYSIPGGTSTDIKTVTDTPPVVNGQAHMGAGAIVGLTKEDVQSWFTNKLPCKIWVNNEQVTGGRSAKALTFDATVTSLAGKTATGSFVAKP